MITLSGIAVSPGIAIGMAHIRYKKRVRFTKKRVETELLVEETEKFFQAIDKEVADVEEFIASYSVNDDDKELLGLQKEILLDPLLREKVPSLIRENNYSAEYAVYNYFLGIKNHFQSLDNNYFAERLSDYEDVLQKLISRLNGESEIDDIFATSQSKSPIILVMEEISPRDVAKSYHSNVAGICLKKGSKTSHSAIIARALGIPVVVNVPEIFTKLNEGNLLILDGNSGRLIIEPNDEKLTEYKKEYSREQTELEELTTLVDLPSETSDGKAISLLCNIELKEELGAVLKNQADGVGLFRTEFLFIDRPDLPDENEQFELYKYLAESLGERDLVIRSFDLGGDKLASGLTTDKEHNPFLGCRGIRLSLKHQEMFKTQIRAVLRASFYGNVSLMFPMVTTIEDVDEALELVEECKIELSEKNLPYAKELKIGAMIEVPATVFIMEHLAKRCDFFSVGTNDLVQYVLAADRNNETVSDYYDPFHPAILKFLIITITTAHRYGKPVSVCGELASYTDFTCLLVGLGVDSLSVNPSVLLSVKKRIRSCDYTKSKQIIKEMLSLENSTQIKRYIREKLRNE